MAQGSLVAVDLGASSGRVIAGRVADGRLHVHETARFANGPVTVPVRGVPRLHWDLLALWAGVQEGLRAAARDHGPVASIGVDTWGVDHGLLDARGALLGEPVHYRDGRTAGMVPALAAVLAPEDQYASTGAQVQPFNTVYQLLAAARSGSLGPAARMLLVPDLLGHWIAGAEVTEVSNASTTGMIDPRTRTWSAPVLDALARAGADVRHLLAPLVEPGCRRTRGSGSPRRTWWRWARTTPRPRWWPSRWGTPPPRTSPRAPGRWSGSRPTPRC
jgi:rhamnulokinase